MNPTRVRIAAEIGLTIALAAVLQLIAVWQLPQGGSYSLTMAPLFVIALLRGPSAGLTAGALYGVIDFLIKPYPPLHPAQWILDYPLAYALVGLAGFASLRWQRQVAEGRGGSAFWTAIVPGVALGALGRYVSHVASGLVFFSSYAIEAGQAPLIYSLAYNSFVLVSAAACAAVLGAVMPQLHRLVSRQVT
ncbi:MAG: energy-coupled thiamine transporter ThiT [Coriobacteriia bacterium]|nr:energy-coupled thiamine transporter ThiT [Coriobacteriia bacterium]